MTASQAYLHPPLALVVLELRHPEAEPLGRSEVADLKSTLRGYTPLHKVETSTEYRVDMVPGGQSVSPPQMRTAQRFLARDKRTSVLVGAESLIIETTRYTGWDRFRALAECAIAARQDVSPVDGLERLGLRYIDEIRTPTESESDWSRWVHRDLMAPTLDSLQPLQQQSVVQYGTAQENETLTLRYGMVDGPPVVQGVGSVIRPSVPKPGPFFLIDTDAAWTIRPEDTVPEVNASETLVVADRLHSHIKGIFESLITDKLREEVLNAE